MATEFYNSIPESIKGKLEEYIKKYSYNPDRPLSERDGLTDCFGFMSTPERNEFWYKHYTNRTFPQWSDELNRFIDPPHVNTITVNTDEYQAMRNVMVIYLAGLYASSPYKDDIIASAKHMGIDISEITN